MKLSYYISFLIITFSIVSCGPKVMYEEEKEVPSVWSYTQSIDFNFEVDDTSNAYNVILSVDYNQEFGYQNLYTKFVTNFPDGATTEDIISLDIRDKSGKTQGKCSGENCTVPFLVQEKTFFKELGKYNLQLYQHSRKDSLSGIKSMKLRIEEVE